ncbi:MAG: hypothetical protein AB7E70_21395 [Hyphomicrobiaceae bacterium]
MSMDENMELRARLSELSKRIDTKIRDLKSQGVMKGVVREAAANWKLQHFNLTETAKAGTRPPSELAKGLEILSLAFERWLARTDKTFEA